MKRALGRVGLLGLGVVLLGGLWPLRAEPPPPLGIPALLAPARFAPAGSGGLVALLGGDIPEGKGVAQAVREQGFYAGEPVGSGDCATCHSEIAAQWSQSAHRFASLNNPYYTASLEQFRSERGAAASRFCAGCHDPLLLVNDAIVAPTLPQQATAAQAGLPCLVCHSVQSCQGTFGNGAYTLALREVPPPGPQGRDPAAGQSAHGARLRPAILQRPELCAACHKVGLLPEITQSQWLRGQNDYDAWQQSMAAGNGVGAVYRPETVEVKRCQDCHMPMVRLRSGQLVRSHRFLAANSALPYLRGDTEEVTRTREFLQGVLSLDLVVQPRPADDDEVPLLDERLSVARNAQLRFEVVLRNRRVGHRFPGGTNDSNDVWVEVAVQVPGPGGAGLRDATHLIRAQPVDEHGEPLHRRDPQSTRGVVYDTAVTPADPQVIRYKVNLGELPEAATAPELVLRAAVRYRKFSRDYARFACAKLPATTPADVMQRCLEPPVIEVAAAERRLVLDGRAGLVTAARGASPPDDKGAPLWQRYLDHGLGLADGLVDQASAARPSLERAAALAPGRCEPLLGLMRLALALGRTDEVIALGAQAAKLRPDHPAALWLPTQALYRTYRFAAARPYVEQLAKMLPNDRNVLTMLARVRGLSGEPQAALEAADRVLQIDAESEDGHHQRLLALRELGRAAEARDSEQRYLYYRRPIELDQELRQQFRAREPARIQEDVPAHTHQLHLGAASH